MSQEFEINPEDPDPGRGIRIGVDVGGTFTDLVAYDERTGGIRAVKVPSDPADLAAGVLAVLDRAGVVPSHVSLFGHGTTIATNAALERKGARLGVVTNRGFRDVLVVGRGNRTRLYDIKAVRPDGLLPRARIHEVAGRLAADGSEVTPLCEAEVAAVAERLRAQAVESVAVCFLHSYANLAHERAVGAILASRLDGVAVTLSADILPEYREFERFSTTALNAAVAPVMASYLRRLSARLGERGVRAPLQVMTSGGGSWRAERMARQPVHSMLSGPAAGVIAARHLAGSLSIGDVITCDMGGTSTDTSLIRGGAIGVTTEGMVGFYPNRVPQIEINTVGAGGGSLASLGAGGFLNVGPRSAGAVPGPACYGRGGTEPTVTDANVVLGRFRPAVALGGAIALDVAAAEAAVAALGRRLGLTPMAMAEGIIRIATTRMTAAIKEISVMRGIDPRDFALLAFGGAGPLHAVAIAEELGMTRILIPPIPGNFSAFGLLVADTRHDFTRTRLLPLDEAALPALREGLAELRAAARDRLRQDGFADADMRFETALDMRFAGQAFELTTPVPDDMNDLNTVRDAFHALYEQRYAFADRGPIEVVSLRLAGLGLRAKPDLPEVAAGDDGPPARVGARPVVFAGRVLDTPVFRRDRLRAGAPLAGPAVIEEEGATAIVPPGYRARVKAFGTLVLERMTADGGA